MKKATREWVRKAEADYQLAILITRKGDPFHDQRCFHCQQSAAKYLKPTLEELGLAVPKIHELERLLTVLQPHYPLLRLQRRGLELACAIPATTQPSARPMPLYVGPATCGRLAALSSACARRAGAAAS